MGDLDTDASNRELVGMAPHELAPMHGWDVILMVSLLMLMLGLAFVRPTED